MSSQSTKPYKRTISGSIGAGMGSLFSPGGKKYYILEHKISSKYHKAGESQEIIVDNIELGRDSHCQVRFDESFKTVSRRHAAIVRDGEMWKLIQLSKTNTTFLNGKPVHNEWYLQNGDEIQLAVNGPKLGFITPTGKKSTVGSIGLTRRLSLFRQQALRPYKTAIATLSCALILAIAGLGTWNYLQGTEYDKLIAEAQSNLNSLKNKNSKLEKLIAEAAVEQNKLDSLLKEKQKPIYKTVYVNKGGGGSNGGEIGTSAEKLRVYEDDIYYLTGIVVAISDGEVIPLKDKKGDLYGWTGTGYLISDGRFITAKHCVEGWKFMTNEDIAEAISSLDEVSSLLYFAGLANAKGVNLRTIIFAKSPSKEFEFSSDQFVMNHSDEKSIKFTDEYTRKVASLVSGADWAYVKTGQAGKIPADASLSANLPAGARLEVLGYPMGDQTSEGSCLYGSCQTSERGLRNGLIMISARNFEQGNSGGPVFYLDKDGYKAVGIVSMGKGDTRGGLIPLSNLR